MQPFYNHFTITQFHLLLLKYETSCDGLFQQVLLKIKFYFLSYQVMVQLMYWHYCNSLLASLPHKISQYSPNNSKKLVSDNAKIIGNYRSPAVIWALSTMEFFWKTANGFPPLTIFTKKLHRRYSIEFQGRLCSYPVSCDRQKTSTHFYSHWL